MKAKQQQIDEGDEAILNCMQAQPQKLNNIIAVTRLNYETGRKRLEKLKRYGHIVSPNFGYYSITKSGLNLLDSRSISVVAPDIKDDSKLQRLIDLLPTQFHQSFFRLLVSGIVAKYLLFDSFTDGYPAFIVGGKTKAFKTSIAKLICLLFGFDNGCIHKLFSATPGEFGIRRVAVGNGLFRPEPSQYFNEPFICLDELDKTTSNDLKRVLLNYADGAREFPIEGVQVINHCTTLITLNTNGDVDAIKSLGIHEAYIRRSVVLNTEQLIGQLKDVDLMAKVVFDHMASRNAPRIRLEALKPCVTRLSEPDYMLMRSLLMGNIAEGYENLVDTQPLELLSIGRAVLLNGDMREAIFQTAYDRLCCLETLGIAKEGWRKRTQTEWAKYRAVKQPGVMEKLKEAEAREAYKARTLEERRSELQTQKESKINERLEFLAEREKIAGNLKNWINNLKTVEKVIQFESQAKAFLEQIKYLHIRIEKTNNYEELMSYVNPYNDLAKKGKELISQYNSWAAGRRIITADSKTNANVEPLEQYAGDWSRVSSISTVIIEQGEQKVVNGLKVNVLDVSNNIAIIEFIYGNKRQAAQVGCGRYVLGRCGIFIQSILEKAIRIEVGTF